MKRHRYTYVLLRYRHDPLAGECVNVGVVLHSADARFLGVRVRKTLGRLGKMFPGISKADLTASLSAIERAVSKLAPPRQITLLGDEPTNAAKLAARALPHDDSSYVWGELASGVTDNPDATLEKLFHRFVTRYDEDLANRRDDAAVWQPVRERLAKHNVLDRLIPKTIVSPLDEVQFGHAWKNGAWHCYQPLSFDLASRESILDKAARWSGHMLGASKAPEQIKPYFIVGAPTDSVLLADYQRAIELLRASPLQPTVFEEGEVDDLVEEIVSEMKEHDRSRGAGAAQ